jgi:hypothetical protein
MDTQRIYQGKDAQWYFNVRGNQSMGPYDTYRIAESALQKHVSACNRRLQAPQLMPKLLGPLKSRRQRSQPRHP